MEQREPEIKILRGNCAVIDNENYIFVRRLADKTLQFERMTDGKYIQLTDSKFSGLIGCGKAKLLKSAFGLKGNFPNGRITPSELEMAKQIQEYLRVFRLSKVNPKSEEGIAKILEIRKGYKNRTGKPLIRRSGSTICRWLRQFPNENCLEDLVLKYHCRGRHINSTLTIFIQEIIDTVAEKFYLNRNRPSITTLFGAINNEIALQKKKGFKVDPVSYSQVELSRYRGGKIRPSFLPMTTSVYYSYGAAQFRASFYPKGVWHGSL